MHFKVLTPSSSSLGGRLLGSLVGVFFVAIGSWFTYLIARSAYEAARTYSWPEVSCVIVSSGVEEHPDAADAQEAFVFTVRYSYFFEGEERVAAQYRPGYKGSLDAGEARRLAERYLTGARTICYVNPRDPASATLRRPSLWVGLAILFPLLFVAVGAGVVFLLWRAPGRGETEAAGETRSISQRARAGTGAGCLAAFFSVFLLAGLGGLYLTTLRPAAQILEARSWKETPCVVVASQVRSHKGDDSTTYSVDILYAYEVNGKEYRSNRYQFLGGSSGGYEGKAKVVARHAPGSRTVCWVDPNDPTDAVLVRGFTKAHLVGLAPLLFAFVGAGGIVFALRAARRKSTLGPHAAWLPDAASAVPEAPAIGPVALKPKASPLGKLLVVILVSLFWNGIVSVFLWQVVRGWKGGDPNWFLTLFLVPFVLVGLLMIVGIAYQFLALFNPRPYLTVGRVSLELGGATGLDWRFTGATGRIARLRIFLEGREEATYRRGTRTYTDHETFATISIVDTTERILIAKGSSTLRVPNGTMHSFEAPHNKIVWTLKVAGEIRSWPDVSEDFQMIVRPLPAGGPA